jgi:branched-chain amino acid transport system ATP-binding protein
MSLLEVEDIWTAYGPIVVNRGVSIAVDEGEIVTIIGSNGAGKSTLLKTIAGLKRPKSGTIRFSDKDVTGTYADGIARCGVVLVPEGRRIFPDLTVRDNFAAWRILSHRLGRRRKRHWGDGVVLSHSC